MAALRDSKGRFIKAPKDAFKLTIIALGNARVSAKVAGRAAMGAAGAAVLKRVKDNTSKAPPASMAALGHPYARRHGEIQVSRLGAAYRDEPYIVHKRSGKFSGAISGGMVSSDPPVFEIKASTNVPWVKHVIQGTRVMLPRDVIWGTAHHPKTRKAIMRGVVTVLGKEMRLQAAVRFSGR